MKVKFKLASYQAGSENSPRYVWSVGIPSSVLDKLPDDPDKHRVKFHAEDGKWYVKFNGEGIKLVRGRPTSGVAWAKGLGIHHVTGMGVPHEATTSFEIEGNWDNKRRVIEVDSPPEMIRNAMLDVTDQPKSDDEQFPATHFTEDMRDAEFMRATSVGSLMGDYVNTIDEHDRTTLEGARAWLDGMVERSKIHIVADEYTVGPALAEALLERNNGNRPIRPSKLEQYIRDMTNDRWQFNGETITISDTGELNNGQHRLHAVMKSNKSIQTLLVFGVSRESRSTVDTGASRGAQDYLALDGYTQPTTLAAATRFLLGYERNDGKSLAGINRLTNSEIIERAKSDPLLEEASMFPYKYNLKSKRLAPPSVIAFTYYLFSQKDPVEAVKFMEQVILGLNLQADDPAYVIREKLLEMSSLLREQKIEVLMRGWNAFRRGRKLRGVRVSWELPAIR